MDDINLGMAILRVAAGVTMAMHGYAKVFKGGKLPGVAGWFDSMGMKPGKIHAPLAAFTEIGAGIGLAVGFLTPLMALAFVGLMTVAGVTVHIKNGFMILNEGWEYVFILAIIAVTIAVVGPGEWSIDGALDLHDDFTGWTGLLISAGGGVAAAAGLLAVSWRPPKAD